MSQCIDQFSKDDLIRLWREAVMFSPKVGSRDCERLQSFAYVKHWAADGIPDFKTMLSDKGVTSNTFGRNKDVIFPLVTMNYEKINLEYPFQKKRSRDIDSYEIAVIDQYIESCEGCGYCGKRDKEQIRCDIRKLWRQGAAYFINSGYYKIEGTNIEDVYRWENKEHLAHRLADVNDESVIGTVLNYPITNHRISEFEEMNSNLEGRYIEIGSTLIGYVVSVKIPMNHEGESFEPSNIKKFKNVFQ